jgi:hypothetical protein
MAKDFTPDWNADLPDPPFPGQSEKSIAATQPSAEPEPQIALEPYATPDYRTEPVSVPVRLNRRAMM